MILFYSHKFWIIITDALEKCIASSSNQVIKNSITRSITFVKEGQLLSYSFSSSKFILGFHLDVENRREQIIFYGEKLLIFIKEVDRLSQHSQNYGTCCFFIVAAIVGTIVVALYLPMFSMLEKF